MGAVNRVTNANCYVDGNNLLGKVKEMELPSGAAKMIEHSALGMQGVVDFPSGFDKFEGKILWNSFYPDALKLLGDIRKFVQMQIRSSMEQYGASGLLAEVPVVISITASPKNLPLGNFKQNENVELETELNISYFKLTIGGKDVYEVDPINNIYKVDGVDKLANYRSNIGQ